jgi:hypothetical protein
MARIIRLSSLSRYATNRYGALASIVVLGITVCASVIIINERLCHHAACEKGTSGMITSFNPAIITREFVGRATDVARRDAEILASWPARSVGPRHRDRLGWMRSMGHPR